MAERLSERVIGLAIEIHREIGPGLLESVYERASAANWKVLELASPVMYWFLLCYKGERLDDGFRADIVEGTIIVEIKAVGAPVRPARSRRCKSPAMKA